MATKGKKDDKNEKEIEVIGALFFYSDKKMDKIRILKSNNLN